MRIARIAGTVVIFLFIVATSASAEYAVLRSGVRILCVNRIVLGRDVEDIAGSQSGNAQIGNDERLSIRFSISGDKAQLSERSRIHVRRSKD